ncbi:hypothetical protein A7C99_7018 [Trichophyton rubrum]|uniref:Uncharacterized protein n=1 Tax=Trichophyton rubrum TaxID=5551 RepID=A0A178EST9_TRIRU|nr:hypothetical protein A7C99_7018 [Trichophyton rubrum]
MPAIDSFSELRIRLVAMRLRGHSYRPRKAHKDDRGWNIPEYEDVTKITQHLDPPRNPCLLSATAISAEYQEQKTITSQETAQRDEMAPPRS